MVSVQVLNELHFNMVRKFKIDDNPSIYLDIELKLTGDISKEEIEAALARSTVLNNPKK